MYTSFAMLTPHFHAADSSTVPAWYSALSRKWTAYNLIGDRCLEIIVALEALNRLVAHQCGSGAGINMNLLLSFTTWAFQRNHNIALVGHRWVSVRILARTATDAPHKDAPPLSRLHAR